MFRIDQLAVLIPEATKLAESERFSFNNIYKIIEDIILKENVIYGGNWGVRLLTNEKRGINDYQYELYSEKAEDVAFSIVNEICKKETKFVSLKKELSDFVLYIEARPLVTIHKLKEHDRGIICPLRINSEKGNSEKGNKIVMPADYHLLDLYRKLYIPNMDDWEMALPLEEELFKMVKFEFNKNQRKFVTGADEELIESDKINESDKMDKSDKMSDDESDLSKSDKSESEVRLELYNRLINYLSSREDVIFVGEYACSLLLDNNNKKDNKFTLHLHIISTIKIAEELNMWIRKLDDPQLKTVLKTNDVHLLNDIRLSRTTIYVVLGNEKYPILYVYNSAEYDLIPYNISKKTTGRIGNPFVIMRYLLVEIWIIKVIREMGGIDEKFAYGKLLHLYKLFMDLRNKLQFNEKNVGSEETNLWGIFNTPELNGQRYIGSYFSDQHSRKQLMRQKFVKEYTPAAYFNNVSKGEKFARNFNDIFDNSKTTFEKVAQKDKKGGCECSNDFDDSY